MKYVSTLAAILALDYQQNAPAKILPRESRQPIRKMEHSFKTGTSRELVSKHIKRKGRDYNGRDYRDIYITAQMIANIEGCSDEAARQRLKYFEKRGILEKITENGRETYYAVASQFTGRDQNTIPSREEAVEAAKELFATAQEGIPRQQYWERFENRLSNSDVLDPEGTPEDKHWYRIQLSELGHLSFHVKKRERDVSVNLVVEESEQAEMVYDHLLSNAMEIESALGYEVEWCGPNDEGSLETEYARIRHLHPDSATYRHVSESPEEYLDWMVDHGERFAEAFDEPLEEALITSFNE